MLRRLCVAGLAIGLVGCDLEPNSTIEVLAPAHNAPVNQRVICREKRWQEVRNSNQMLTLEEQVDYVDRFCNSQSFVPSDSKPPKTTIGGTRWRAA